MATNVFRISPENRPIFYKALFVLFTFALGIVVFWVYPLEYGVDWNETFFPASQNIGQPYHVRTFITPPWTVWILYPIALFPQRLSLAINASLSLVLVAFLVIQRGGNGWALILTLTSVPFVLLVQVGGIEWISALGLLLQNEWGLLLLITKPQAGVLAGVSWLSASSNKVKLVLPSLLLLVVSFLVWGNWMKDIAANVRYVGENYGLTWNLSPFPWLVPLGLGILFYIIKNKPTNGEFLGILATLCLVPYFAVHTLVIFFALLSVYHRRAAVVLWLMLWIYPLVVIMST